MINTVLLAVLLSISNSIKDVNVLNRYLTTSVYSYVYGKDVLKSVNDIKTLARARVVKLYNTDKDGNYITCTGVKTGYNQVLTARHCTAFGPYFNLIDLNGRRSYGVLAKNSVLDLAVIITEDLNMADIEFGTVDVGDWGFIIGNPLEREFEETEVAILELGTVIGPDGMPTPGIVFGCNGVRPGYSGGGLFNDKGQLVGIMSFKQAGMFCVAIPVR